MHTTHLKGKGGRRERKGREAEALRDNLSRVLKDFWKPSVFWVMNDQINFPSKTISEKKTFPTRVFKKVDDGIRKEKT